MHQRQRDKQEIVCVCMCTLWSLYNNVYWVSSFKSSVKTACFSKPISQKIIKCVCVCVCLNLCWQLFKRTCKCCGPARVRCTNYSYYLYYHLTTHRVMVKNSSWDLGLITNHSSSCDSLDPLAPLQYWCVPLPGSTGAHFIKSMQSISFPNSFATFLLTCTSRNVSQRELTITDGVFARKWWKGVVV